MADQKENISGGHKHGFLGDSSWKGPRLAVECDEMNRIGYDGAKAHEYLDHTSVLKEKVKVLANMIRESKNMIVYSGAGISTASGIGDYATKAGKKSLTGNKKPIHGIKRQREK